MTVLLMTMEIVIHKMTLNAGSVIVAYGRLGSICCISNIIKLSETERQNERKEGHIGLGSARSGRRSVGCQLFVLFKTCQPIMMKQF